MREGQMNLSHMSCEGTSDDYVTFAGRKRYPIAAGTRFNKEVANNPVLAWGKNNPTRF
jgi:hypothetical protein